MLSINNRLLIRLEMLQKKKNEKIQFFINTVEITVAVTDISTINICFRSYIFLRNA